MVPDSLGRRGLLVGLGGLVAGGTVAVGATEPTALPDVLTDEATKHYPTPPEVNSLWRPTVTEAHATEAIDRLAETVSRGEKLRSQIETDDHFVGSGGWLENAREARQKGNYYEALFHAVGGLQYAGEDLGFARAKLGRSEADLRTLAERERDVRERVQAVADDVDPYPVVEPGRDLAWYYRIERELVFARFNASNGLQAALDGGDEENDSDAREFDPEDVGTVTANLLEAEGHLRNAERFRDRLTAKLDGSRSTASYAEHLGDVAGRFRTEIREHPTRGDVRETFVDDDDGPYDSYEYARSRIARWCFDSNYRFGMDDSDGLLVYRAVELSRGLAQRRAHGPAVDRLVVEEGDSGFDSGHALAEKRRARATYRSVVGSEPPPLLTRQVRRAVEDLQVAKVGFAGNYQRPLWRERLKAYLYALVGRAKLEQYPEVYDAVVDAD